MEVVDRLLTRTAKFGRATVTRPLDPAELIAATIILFVGGTLYCVLYCRIAFYPMHAGRMPLWLSAWWAATSLLPWLSAFELLKRLAPRIQTTLIRIIACLAIAAAAAAVTVLAYYVGDVEMMGMSTTHWSMLIASQLQPTVVFGLLVGLWATQQARPDTAKPSSDAHSEALPPLATIDWIRAAGNYVELKCGERLLIRRMTMRNAEAATTSADFIRIHRSLIVRRTLIDGFAGNDRSRVILSNGETLPVGESYRATVERLVPSSQDLALGPIEL